MGSGGGRVRGPRVIPRKLLPVSCGTHRRHATAPNNGDSPCRSLLCACVLGVWVCGRLVLSAGLFWF